MRRFLSMVLSTGMALTGAGIWDSLALADTTTVHSASFTNLINDVACASASTCYAVGANSPSAGQSVGTVTLVTNGTPATTTQVPSAYNLVGITCPTSTTCYVTGADYYGYFLLLTLTNGAITNTQTTTAVGSPAAIACADSTHCYGLGRTVAAPSTGTILPVISGTLGSAVSVPSTWLDGITCISASTCYVVGGGPGGGGIVVTLTNGTPGTPQTASSGMGEIHGIACPGSTTNCIAAGTMNFKGGIVAVNAGVPGATQTVNTTSFLDSIRCRSTTVCYAGGQANTESYPTVNPGVSVKIDSGTVSQVDTVSGSQRLTGIACPSTDACYAGAWSTYGNIGETVTIAPSPTLARVGTFAARRIGHATVQFRWNLPATNGVAGFELYAGNHRLNDHLIAVHHSPQYTFRCHWITGDRFFLRILFVNGGHTTISAG